MPGTGDGWCSSSQISCGGSLSRGQDLNFRQIKSRASVCQCHRIRGTVVSELIAKINDNLLPGWWTIKKCRGRFVLTALFALCLTTQRAEGNN